MSEVRPAAGPEPARWLIEPGVDWWDLVRFGPPGFEVYVRIAFEVGSPDSDDDDGEAPLMRAVLAVLEGRTTTPANAFAAIWKGWAGGLPAPAAPLVPVPQRAMLLVAGPVAELRDAPALAWFGSAAAVYQEPNLVWPDDHAWCLACEVDEEIEFTVGCSLDASEELVRALPGGAVRRVSYGEPAPLYRE